MGVNFRQHEFNETQREIFDERIQSQLSALRIELSRACYNEDRVTFGAELELYLVDRNFQPAAINNEVIAKAQYGDLQEELNRYNLECNLSPVNATGTPFSALQSQLDSANRKINQAASIFDCKALAIGILPTLEKTHLTEDYITNRPRFKALSKELTKLRGNPFHIDIHGHDVVNFLCHDIALEGANTSFQFHHRIPVSRFTECFNTAQLITPLVLALAGNSPIFLGKRLWQETRIALFKQAVDLRQNSNAHWREPSRVGYGHGWLREGIVDCLTESVALYPAVLPVTSENLCGNNDDKFAELLLHHGTVWNWNRAIFEHGDAGHVRIEYRSLPAGPTSQDMLANAALLVGLVEGLSSNCEEYIKRLPFRYSEFNFYRCAQYGLQAQIIWPEKNQTRLQEFRVTDILSDLLPVADLGLASIGVDRVERDYYLGIIEHRLASRQTGALWQLNCYKQLLDTYPQHKVLQELCRRYYQGCQSGQPIAFWE